MGTAEGNISMIDKETFAQASERGRQLLADGPVATAATYKAGRIHVELGNGCAFEFPVVQTQGLAGAKTSELRVIEISAGGLGLHWPKLDVDLYVPALVEGSLGTTRWMRQIGAAGGRAKSSAKGAAARANGKLGGRPRKPPQTQDTA